MNEVKSTRHSRYMLQYHIAWIPKYRRKILVKSIAIDVETYLNQVALEKEWEIIALEVQPDHIHLFVSAPPSVSPSNIVKAFKGISARRLLMKYPQIAKKTKRGTIWASSYYVGTAGAASSETIKRYIEECQG